MPGFKTFAAGEVLTAADVNDYLMEQAVTYFSSAAARDAAITSPNEGQTAYLADNNLVTVYNGSAWVCTSPVSAWTETAESHPQNTAYADLATAGPAVTVETGTKALIVVSCLQQAQSTACIGYMSFAISGDTTLAAGNARAATTANSSGVGWIETAQLQVYYTSLTAGDNTFTAKYATSNNGTGVTFSSRTITVWGIP